MCNESQTNEEECAVDVFYVHSLACIFEVIWKVFVSKFRALMVQSAGGIHNLIIFFISYPLINVSST